MSAPRTALLAGATGLVGGHCLARLLTSGRYEVIHALVRKPLELAHPSLRLHVVDFERLESADLPRAADVFCCLGTTIKRAGSEAAFRRVDLEYVAGLARRTFDAGADQFLVISSVGARKDSPAFYTRVKAEMEEALKAIPFGGLQIFRPSFLVGDRRESRPGERLAVGAFSAVSFLMGGKAKKYRPIRAEAVATAMVRVAGDAPRGVNVYESDRIAELAKTI